MALDVVSKAKQRLARMGLRQVIRGVRRDPEKNFSRLVSLGRRFASAPQHRQMMGAPAERLQRDPQLVDKIRLALKNPKLIES